MMPVYGNKRKEHLLASLNEGQDNEIFCMFSLMQTFVLICIVPFKAQKNGP